MNLIIDVGNTLIKLAVFAEGTLLVKRSTVTDDFLKQLEAISEDYPEINHCILASVGEFSETFISALKSKFNLLQLNKDTKVPFENEYGTLNTLGVDRIALASAAVKEYPRQNVLVIDAGSCITYELLTEENKYIGGAISPGIQMRFKALHYYTANLPLLKPELPVTELGSTTVGSIQTGVLQAVVHEMDGFITQYNEKHPDLTVILTGGDAHFLLDSLKSDIFANSNFLLEGLNYLVEHNKN